MNSNDKKKVELLICKAIEDVAFFRLSDERDPAKLLDVAYYLSVAQKLMEQSEYGQQEGDMNEHIARFELEDQARQWCEDFLADERLQKTRRIVEKNLLIRIEKGTYDSVGAQKLWLYFVEDGIKAWNGGSLKGFDLRFRREIAKKAAEEFYRRYELGEFKDESSEV